MSSHAPQGSAPQDGDLAGDLIDGRYQLLHLLDSSEGVERWAARDLRLNREVAVHLDTVNVVGGLEEYLRRIVQGATTQVYDAGSHGLESGSCTFVVTPRPDVTLSVDEAVPAPLSVGTWSTPVTTYRGSSRRYGSDPMVLVSQWMQRIRRTADPRAAGLVVASVAVDAS